MKSPPEPVDGHAREDEPQSPARAAAPSPGDAPGVTRSTSEAEAIESALEKSKLVKQKVDSVADRVETANRQVKKQIEKGVKTLPADATLTGGERVESAVKEVALDLHRVNDVLSVGVEQIRETEKTLAMVQTELAQTEATLSTARREEQIARHRALHDAATGLPNRELFDDRLTQAISLAERQAWTVAVMFLDLDGFKVVNDTHGHAAGDFVLTKVAGRLSQHVREQDTVCRNGGDEFLLLLVNPQGIDNVLRVAEAIRAAIAEPIAMGRADLFVGSSIGIACYPEHALTAAQLVELADQAMYRVKRCGGGQAVWEPST